MAWSAGAIDGQCPVGPVNKEQSHDAPDRTHVTPDSHRRNPHRTLDEALLELLADWEQF